MSANLIVDIGNTCQFYPSIIPPSGGVMAGLSGVAQGYTVGTSVDMLHANTMCQLQVVGVPLFNSGLVVGIQCADSDVSGQYTDPTSGYQTFPTSFSSGGLLWINSGGTGGILSSGATSGFQFLSGFIQYAAFQRTQRFVRAIFPPNTSGNYGAGNFSIGFVSQYKTTGSGGGYTPQPTSGAVNV